ncbi:MAG: CapA family protein [Lentisphaeria bacterium]
MNDISAHSIFELVIAGDLAPIRAFAPVIQRDPLAVYGDLLPDLRSADCRIVNLESPLDGEQFIVKSGAAFTGSPEHLAALTSVPFEVVTLANNHTFDTGQSGFHKTTTLLEKAGIAYVGAGKNRAEAEKALCIERNNVKIAIFNLSEGEDMLAATDSGFGVAGWDIASLVSRIRAAKESQLYHAVIAIVHCGLEYYPFPSYYVYEAFRAIADAGADLIVGHHPHVPQGRTLFGKTPAFFSLGNFVFYQDTPLIFRKTGYFLKLKFDPSGLLSTRTVPYRIEANALRHLNDKETQDFEKLFAELSAALATPVAAQAAWEACLAWYGEEGYHRELEKICSTWENHPEKAAAMLRNRVLCMQHQTHWRDGLSRIVNGSIGHASTELQKLVQAYFTERILP